MIMKSPLSADVLETVPLISERLRYAVLRRYVMRQRFPPLQDSKDGELFIEIPSIFRIIIPIIQRMVYQGQLRFDGIPHPLYHLNWMFEGIERDLALRYQGILCRPVQAPLYIEIVLMRLCRKSHFLVQGYARNTQTYSHRGFLVQENASPQ